MVQQCECNVVGNFPELRNLGFTSITLRTNTPIIITSDNNMVLVGATTGELTVSAYGSMKGYPFACPGRAGASYDWENRYNCLTESLYYIPRGGAKSYVEGDVGIGVTTDVAITGAVKYPTVQASASSGPATIYLRAEQTDGYGFSYLGGPIKIKGRMINVIGSDGNFDTGWDGTYNNYGAFTNILPIGSQLFLNNFSWEQTPPDLASVSYTFAYTGAEYELLVNPLSYVTCPDGRVVSV
jgi:hypothetical protein